MRSHAIAHGLLAAAFVGAGALAPVTAVAATSLDHVNSCWSTDNGKPVLDSVTFSPATADTSSAPAHETVTVHAHDTGGPGAATGIAHVGLRLEGDTADSGKTVAPPLSVHLVPSGHDTWTGSLVVPRGANATYDADPVVRDQAGLYAGDDLGLRPIRHALDVSGTPDTTRPELTHLSVSATKVDTRRHQATVRVRATLHEVGASPERLTMAGPGNTTVRLTRRPGTDTFATAVVIPRWSGSSRWHLSFGAFDNDLNGIFIGHAWLESHGFPATIRIRSGQPDTTAPRISSVSRLPSTLDLRHHGRLVALRVRAADAHGVRAVKVSLFGRDGAGSRTRTATFHLVSGTARRGTWSGRIPVSRCFPGPLRAYAYVRAIDDAGNSTEIDRGDVRLVTLDRRPPMDRFHSFTRHAVLVRFSEPVHGISTHHVAVLTAKGAVVQGTWACLGADGHSVSCLDGPASSATFTPEAGSHGAYEVNWERDHRLDVLDRAGNPFQYPTYAGE
jgi:hypothetical protein